MLTTQENRLVNKGNKKYKTCTEYEIHSKNI